MNTLEGLCLYYSVRTGRLMAADVRSILSEHAWPSTVGSYHDEGNDTFTFKVF